MFCQKCGNSISDNEYYCPYCGKELPNKRNLINSNQNLTIGQCYINFFKKGFFVDGVATRKEYWIIFITHVIINLVLGILNVNYINTIINIILFFPITALAIRRYHDIDKSGAWALLGGYGQIGYMFSFFFEDKKTITIILITAIISYLLQQIILTKPTNEKSRWNPVNGYM